MESGIQNCFKCGGTVVAVIQGSLIQVENWNFPNCQMSHAMPLEVVMDTNKD